MNRVAIYRYIADSNKYECISVARDQRGLLEAFCDCKSLADWWKPIPVQVDSSVCGPGDFPSLDCHAPVFSERAWVALSPLIGHAAQALPLIYPDDQVYFVLNVLELVDCLDQSESVIDRYSDGRISHVEKYVFIFERLKGKDFFKIPETAGLEVLVSDRFIGAVESNGLKGLIFKKLD